MNAADLYIVSYCHRSCQPLMNIMRLPEEKAFALAHELALQNEGTTAFYRFADFAHYYPERMKTDALLYARFKELGGRPVQEHPLSFVLQGSSYLDDWFDRGIVTRVPLKLIPSESISFTYGDSMSSLKRQGKLMMITKEMLLKKISEYNGTLDKFMIDIENTCHYIEAQLWDDDCLAGIAGL